MPSSYGAVFVFKLWLSYLPFKDRGLFLIQYNLIKQTFDIHFKAIYTDKFMTDSVCKMKKFM